MAGKQSPCPQTPHGRIPYPAVIGSVVDDNPLGPEHIQKIGVDLEKALLLRKALSSVAVDAGCPGSMGHEGHTSESKRASPRLETIPTSTKSIGVPRPVVSESKTTNSPSDKRERAHRMASSRLPIRAGGASVGMLLILPILLIIFARYGCYDYSAPFNRGVADEPLHAVCSSVIGQRPVVLTN